MIYMGLPESEKTLAAIGAIAIRHGQLDYAFKMAVKDLAGVSVVEALNATAKQGSAFLRDRVQRLAKRRLGEATALVKLDAILNRARQATNQRNDLLHSLWAMELDEAPVMKRTGRI